MSKRATRWVRAQELALTADQPPDFTGMTAQQMVLWAAKHGQYEEIVKRANDGYKPRMVVPEDREAGPGAGSEAPNGSEVAEAAAPPDSAAVTTPQPEPERQREYWEEKCQWRHRGPDDCDWDDRPRGYECEYEYDPLEQGWQEIVRGRR